MPTGYYYARRAATGLVRRPTRQMVDYDKLATPTIGLLISFFRAYPDLMEEILCGDRPDYHNSLLNAVTKRYMARYQETFTYAARGYGKTTCVVSSRCNQGILWPGEITGYYAPSDAQAAPLASKAFATYERNNPILAAHWTRNNDAKETFKASTPHGSQFLMTVPRGLDTSGVVAEECAQTDGNAQFNFAEFNQIVIGTNRKQHMVNGEPDPKHVDNQIHYISSCGSKEHESFQVCESIRKSMAEGGSAYALFIPWQAVVLCRMKPVSYYQMLKAKLTSEQFMRECESKCTGTAESPIIKDSVLMEASTLMVMEDRHCGDKDAFYVIGYDVSSRDVAGNALTAMAVVKCTRQYHTEKKDRYKKQLVYVMDSPPPKNAKAHARLIKSAWRDFSMAGGLATYIVIDARQYGQSVVEALHEDLGDGLPPLATVTHEEPYSGLEHEGAVPCVYPLQATASTGRDPNIEMLDYIEREFENGNFNILTSDLVDGVKAYKLKHGIKDDSQDAYIQFPYIKTRELRRQIANLQKRYTSVGYVEAPISKHIVHDMWSATLYAARFVQKLEREELYNENRRSSEWEEYASKTLGSQIQALPSGGRQRSVARMGRLRINR